MPKTDIKKFCLAYNLFFNKIKEPKPIKIIIFTFIAKLPKITDKGNKAKVKLINEILLILFNEFIVEFISDNIINS